MTKVAAKAKGTIRAVVRDANGNIKRDYGVVARSHPNPVISRVYVVYYVVKRKVLDVLFALGLK